MINAYTSLPTQDVVGVFDGYSQVFAAARPMQASITEEARLMEHPLESGGTVTDHMVVQPVSIELQMLLPAGAYRDTYKEIKGLFLAGRILTVQTKTDIYRNLIIEALPHEERPEMFDAVTLDLRLKEITTVKAEDQDVYKPQQAAQTGTVARGEVQAEETRGSWLFSWLGG